jgi:hypothetical protein
MNLFRKKLYLHRLTVSRKKGHLYMQNIFKVDTYADTSNEKHLQPIDISTVMNSVRYPLFPPIKTKSN